MVSIYLSTFEKYSSKKFAQNTHKYNQVFFCRENWNVDSQIIGSVYKPQVSTNLHLLFMGQVKKTDQPTDLPV